MQPQQLETVADDTPCRPCGYNLRGLSPWGRCPECGGDVQDTLRAMRMESVAKRGIEHANPKSLNEWIEGIWCVIAWFVTTAATGFDNPAYYHAYWNRATLLGVLATGWTVGWLGIWKLSRTASNTGMPMKGDGTAIALRVLTVISTPLPLVWGLLLLFNLRGWEGLCVPSLVAFVGTIAVFHFRLGRLASILPATSLSWQLYFLMIAVWFGCVASVSDIDDVWSSLGMMLALPSPAFVTGLWIGACFDLGRWVSPLLLIIAGISGWEITVLILLLIKLIRVKSNFGMDRSKFRHEVPA